MVSQLISFFTNVIFIVFLAAPTAITLLDIDHDSIVLLNSNEEEEQESKDVKEIEIVSHLNYHYYDTTIVTARPFIAYVYLQNYTSNTLELASPPPEFS